MRIVFDVFPADDPKDGDRLVRLTVGDQLLAGSGLRVELFGLGSGIVVVNKNHPDVTTTNFAPGNYVRVYDLDISEDIALFGFFFDERFFQVLSESEGGGQVQHHGGPGVMNYFGRAMLDNINYIHLGDDLHFGPHVEDGQWHWYDDQYGDILKRLIDEAQDTDRPDYASLIPAVTYDFDSTNDSNGDAWSTFSGEYKLPIGINYLPAVQQLINKGLFVRMTPEFLLQAYQSGGFGVDHTGAAFASGVVRFVSYVVAGNDANIIGNLPRTSRPSLPATRALVKGDSVDPSTMRHRTTTAPITREIFVEVSGTHAAEALDDAGDKALELHSDAGDTPILKHVPGLNSLLGLYSPFPGTTTETVVVTSSSWKIALTGTPPAGWHDPGFDDSAYGNAIHVSVGGGGAWYDSASTRWIWSAEATGSPPKRPSGEERSFRHEFTLAELPITARVQVAADNGCEVYVNGTLVASHQADQRGATDTVPHAYNPPVVYTFDPVLLNVGANCISIIGWNETNAAPGPAGVYATLTLGAITDLYWVGDMVTISTGTGVGDYDEVDQRVYAINWEVDSSGHWWPRPELGPTLFEDGSSSAALSAPPSPMGSGSSGGGSTTTPLPIAVVRELTNKSGGTVDRGDVVVLDTDNDEAFETTTLVGETRQVGVALASIAADAKGLVALSGYVEIVNVPGSATRGHWGVTGSPAKTADDITERTEGAFCQFLTSGTEPSALLFGVPDSASPSSNGEVRIPALETHHRFIICAHQGDINATDGYPEGSLEAMRQAIIRGAHWIDCDLRKSSDGTWHILHDSTLTRTTNLSGAISSASDATIAGGHIDGGNGYDAGRHGSSIKVPTLQQLVDALKPYPCVFQFDNKIADATTQGELAQFAVDNGIAERVAMNLNDAGEIAAVEAVSTAIFQGGPEYGTPDYSTITDFAWVAAQAPVWAIGVVPRTEYPATDEAAVLEDLWNKGARGITANDIPATVARLNELLVLDQHLDDTADAHDAAAISVADAGAYFAGTEVETALQELGAAIATFAATSHFEVLMTTGISDPPDPLLSSDGTDWLYGEVTP